MKKKEAAKVKEIKIPGEEVIWVEEGQITENKKASSGSEDGEVNFAKTGSQATGRTKLFRNKESGIIRSKSAKTEERGIRKEFPVKKKKINFYRLFWLFFLGAFVGDLIETIFCLITMGKLMSRSSVIYGPFSVVWGLGFLFLTIALRNLEGRRDTYIFFMGTVLGGIYEYICSLVTEYMFGASFWNYSGIPFNLNGRINLLFCFFWGIIAVLWVQNIYPYLEKKTDKIVLKTGKTFTVFICIVMLLNMLISSLALKRADERREGIETKSTFDVFLDQHYPDERLARIYPNMRFVE